MYSCQKDYNDPGAAESQYYGSRSGVAVRAIILAQMPHTDPAGQPWDVADTIDTLGLPDVFYRMSDNDSSDYPVFAQPFHFENLNADSLPVPYFLTTPYKVRAFGSNLKLDIYDFEKSPDSSFVDSTLMKSFIVNIHPGDSLVENPYPDSLLLNEDGYAVFLFFNWIK
jgi:hypothetical protein